MVNFRNDNFRLAIGDENINSSEPRKRVLSKVFLDLLTNLIYRAKKLKPSTVSNNTPQIHKINKTRPKNYISKLWSGKEYGNSIL